jgi:hypothetical protein
LKRAEEGTVPSLPEKFTFPIVLLVSAYAPLAVLTRPVVFIAIY